MKKVIIIGCSGSGKSTLAAALARKIGVPHTELDSIFHQADWKPIDSESFRLIVHEKAEGDGWVFCGNYYSKLGGAEFLNKADTVIWLDYSFALVFSRVVRRTLKRSLTRQELWNGNRERFFVNFFTRDSVIRHMMLTWRKQKLRYAPLFDGSHDTTGTRFIRITSPTLAQVFLDEASR